MAVICINAFLLGKVNTERARVRKPEAAAVCNSATRAHFTTHSSRKREIYQAGIDVRLWLDKRGRSLSEAGFKAVSAHKGAVYILVEGSPVLSHSSI